MIRREVIEYDETFLEMRGALYRVTSSLDGTASEIHWPPVRPVGDVANTSEGES